MSLSLPNTAPASAQPFAVRQGRLLRPFDSLARMLARTGRGLKTFYAHALLDDEDEADHTTW